MYEYEIMHKVTEERTFIWGYSYADAMKRTTLNPDEWECLHSEYVD